MVGMLWEGEGGGRFGEGLRLRPMLFRVSRGRFSEFSYFARRDLFWGGDQGKVEGSLHTLGRDIRGRLWRHLVL